jgi:hypothetical protein
MKTHSGENGKPDGYLGELTRQVLELSGQARKRRDELMAAGMMKEGAQRQMALEDDQKRHPNKRWFHIEEVQSDIHR